MYDPSNPLTDRQVDQFLVLARSVGTFGRALDSSSTVRQPSLHMSAAAASRDITLVSRTHRDASAASTLVSSPMSYVLFSVLCLLLAGLLSSVIPYVCYSWSYYFTVHLFLVI